MTTKVKGLLKGLRYISQIFDEEKEQDMQIGFPTDVKHVAHIGWDGPSVDSSPSWMKDFTAPPAGQSAPLALLPGDPKESPEIKWVSEDSKTKNASSSPARDLPELPKSSRRHSSSENGSSDSPKKESSKSRSSRRHHSKESPDGTKPSRHVQQLDSIAGSESPARNLPDIPKKSRRKKSKESIGDGSVRSSRSSKSKATSSSSTSYSDPGPERGSESSVLDSKNSELANLEIETSCPRGREGD